MSNNASEFNRGCYAILSGLLGGAMGAVAFIVLSFVVSLVACFVLIVILSAIVQQIDVDRMFPEPRYTPKGYERSITMLNYDQNPGTIRTNVQGGTLTMNQTINLETLDFKPDPTLIGNPIRAYDASKKYNVAHNTITQWADAGIVAILERGPKLLVLDEATVARAAAIFKEARRLTTPRRAAWILKRAIA